MNNNKVEVTLLVTNKSGILSALMIKGGSLGLMYRRQSAQKLNDNISRIIVSFEGKLNCSQQQSVNVFTEHPEVIKVEKIVIHNPENAVNNQSAAVTKITDTPVLTKTIKPEVAAKKTAVKEQEVDRSAMTHFL